MPLAEALLKLFPPVTVEGLEKQLLRRKRTERISGLVAVTAIVAQILAAAASQEYLEGLGQFLLNLSQFRAEPALLPQLVGLGVVFVGVATFLALRWTSFLLRESKEAFRYTFWIDQFKRVDETPQTRYKLEEEDRLKGLLHHDLVEELNRRIGRFSLLADTEALADSSFGSGASSHIHIHGMYAIREDRDGWVIHVMPYVRIGPPGTPETIAEPVRFRVELEGEGRWSAARYYRLVERVYSSVATEIYKQIESDVEQKIHLFPTPFLRAVALLHEAEDFARSNTLDAYDRSLDLYREARKYFERFDIPQVRTWLLRRRFLLWRTMVKFQHAQARAQLGYAKTLIFRRYLCAQSGRLRNPPFEILQDLPSLIKDLDELQKRLTGQLEDSITQNKSLAYVKSFVTQPGDTLARLMTLRPKVAVMEYQRRLLFEAYVIAALAYYSVDSVREAKEHLQKARNVDPQRSSENALYLLAAGAIQPKIEERIQLFIRATECAPHFQIARFLLAQALEKKLRVQDEIVVRAHEISDQYDLVLRINPGNVASLAAQGYLLWLAGRSEEARRKFEEGLEVKEIVGQTFSEELEYGIARIEAEGGHFGHGLDFYERSTASNPAVAAFYPAGTDQINWLYEYVTPSILTRYEQFRKTAQSFAGIAQSGPAHKTRGESKTRDFALSFILNEIGNVCFNYYLRYLDPERLKEAITSYREATEKNPLNLVAFYNLRHAYAYQGAPEDSAKILKSLSQTGDLREVWPAEIISSAQVRLRLAQLEVQRIRSQAERRGAEAREKLNQIDSKADELLKEKLELDNPVKTGIMEPSQPKALSYPVGKPIHEWRTERRGLESAQRQVPTGGVGETSRKIELRRQHAKELEVEIEKLAREFNEAIAEAASLVKEGDVKEMQTLEDVRPDIQGIFARSRLSTVFEACGLDPDGKGIEKFLQSFHPLRKRWLQAGSLRSDRIDETDVRALRVWAECYSFSMNARTPVEKLCDEIKRQYYPDSFDVNQILDEMNQRRRRVLELKRLLSDLEQTYLEKEKPKLEKALPSRRLPTDSPRVHVSIDRTTLEGEIQQCESAIRHCRETMLPTIDQWYYEDPVSLLPLRWIHDLVHEYVDPKDFKPGECQGRCEAALGEIDRLNRYAQYRVKTGPYHYMIGNHYIAPDADRQTLQKAFEHFRIAAKGSPESVEFQRGLDDVGRRLAEQLNREGNEQFSTGESGRAADLYKEALKFSPKDDVIHSNLARALQMIKTPGERETALKEAVAELTSAMSLAPHTDEYRDRLRYVNNQQRMLEFSGEQFLDYVPATVPVAVEVSSDLSHYLATDDEGLTDQAQSVAKELRDELFEQSGFRIPGIRFRTNQELITRTLRILMWEVPIDQAEIRDVTNFFEELRKRLGTAVRQNLAGLLGIQDVARMLEDSPLSRDVVERVRENAVVLVSLTATLRKEMSYTSSKKDLGKLLAELAEPVSVAGGAPSGQAAISSTPRAKSASRV